MHDVEHAYRVGYEEGYRAAERDIFMRNYMGNPSNPMEAMATNPSMSIPAPPTPSKSKRKVSPYHKRLGKAIKALRAKHLLKNGKWRKGWNQKKMMKAAHKAAKKS